MIVNEDLLNVMGSFSGTALDCIEKQNEEIEDLKKENARLKDKENKIIKKLESYNLDYLHETNEHNLADTIEYLLELLKEN